MCMNAATATHAVAQASRPIEAFLGHAAQGAMVLRCGDALHAVDEQHLAAQCEAGGVLDLDERGMFRPLAAGLGPWQKIGPCGQVLWVMRDGAIDQIDLAWDAPPRRLVRSATGAALVAVHGASGHESLLCVTRDDSESDLSTH